MHAGRRAGSGCGRATGRRHARISFRSVDRGSRARRRPWRVSDCSAELNRFHAPVEGGRAPECRAGQVALSCGHFGKLSLALSPVPTGWLESYPAACTAAFCRNIAPSTFGGWAGPGFAAVGPFLQRSCRPFRLGSRLESFSPRRAALMDLPSFSRLLGGQEGTSTRGQSP